MAERHVERDINNDTRPGESIGFEFKPVKKWVYDGQNPITGKKYWKTIIVDDGTPSKKPEKSESVTPPKHVPAQQPTVGKDLWRRDEKTPD